MHQNRSAGGGLSAACLRASIQVHSEHPCFARERDGKAFEVQEENDPNSRNVNLDRDAPGVDHDCARAVRPVDNETNRGDRAEPAFAVAWRSGLAP